ncbi:hypothetical protein G7Y79_00039g075440 [Physcia stellaris]|nr:hypothetical protein G7Y79_00039g075440 [Physcia stellaris]
MQLSYLILSSLACLAAATPIEKRHLSPWPTPIRTYFSALSSRLSAIRAANPQSLPTCTFSSAVLPNSSLPAPSPGLIPYHIAVGRGTQNYTCDTTNPQAAPKAVGALATLYNTSCLAAINPYMLSLVPAAALSVPSPRNGRELFPAQSVLSGHHYFSDLTTATFNLHTETHNFGITFNKKIANVTAPAANPGNVPNKGPDGSKPVPWLKLQTQIPNGNVSPADDLGGVREVYRVNTAGGAAPSTCSGMPASFEVQYAAEYWFFGTS